MSSLPPKDGVIGRLAAARTRERITAMVPLIWLAQRRENRIGDCSPHLVKAEDVPVYALDKHTRLGREPIWRFACENNSVRVCLARFVPPSQRRSAAHGAGRSPPPPKPLPLTLLHMLAASAWRPWSGAWPPSRRRTRLAGSAIQFAQSSCGQRCEA